MLFARDWRPDSSNGTVSDQLGGLESAFESPKHNKSDAETHRDKPHTLKFSIQFAHLGAPRVIFCKANHPKSEHPAKHTLPLHFMAHNRRPDFSERCVKDVLGGLESAIESPEHNK